jgi:hypothetical protein
VARPFWFRLFGPDGPSTFAELRAALMTSPIGEEVGDGRFLARLQALIERPANLPDRPAQNPDQNPDTGAHDRAILAQAVLTALELAAAPAPTAEAGAPVLESPQDVRFALDAGANDSHSATLYLNGAIVNSLADIQVRSPFAFIDPSQAYTVLGDLQSGLVIDNHNRTLMPGGIGDYPEIGRGSNDTVVLDGDYAAGFGLGTPDFVEQVLVTGDNDFSLVADDGNVAPGATLTINAMPLGDGHHIAFDGSAETNGRFLFLGSQADDVFFGGAGDDRIYGHGGADILSGGGGSDIFGYGAATQSTGPDYDIIADFDPAADRIDLDVTVASFDDAVQGGTLSAGSFDADLGAALAGLGTGHAVIYTPDAGDLAGNLFLIVDANGIAGYQAGEDYVFALPGTTPADLNGHTGFFI